MSSEDDEGNKFSVSHKILIMAIASLIGVIIVIILLHLYSKYLLRRQERRRGRAMVHHLPLSVIEAAPNIEVNSSGQPKNNGLDRSIIDSLPLFSYKATDQLDHGEGIECTVCLNGIGQDAMVRVLPNCKHMFHAECIDMWLSLHTTCPICRTMAEPKMLPEQSGLAIRVQPTAPPLEGSASVGTTEKVEGSGSQISSFRRMLGRD